MSTHATSTSCSMADDGKPRQGANGAAGLDFLQQVCRCTLNHGLARRITEGAMVVFGKHQLVVGLLLAGRESLLQCVPIT